MDNPFLQDAQDGADLSAAVRDCLKRGDNKGLLALLDAVPAADVAALLVELDNDELAAVFRVLDPGKGAEVLDELPAEDIRALAQRAPIPVCEAVGEMEPDEVADVLEALPEAQAEAILDSFPEAQASAAEHLLAYRPDTAGGLMTTQFVALPRGVTARQAVEITQQSSEAETVGHLFVVDDEGLLVGYLPLPRLVFASPDRKVEELMEAPRPVGADTDQEELLRFATRYDVRAVPVVDESNKLLGVVTADDLLEAAAMEADKDLFRLAGTGLHDPVHAGIPRSAAHRLPWLLLSVLDGLFIAFIVSHFADTLKVIELAFFIPLIPLMGGQAAIQSSTIVVRGLALGALRRSMITRFLGKQVLVTLVLAVCCALATALLGSLLVGTKAQLMLAVGLAVAVSINISGALGLMFPLIFNKMGIDPAVSSGPFITMLNDVIGVFIYLVLGMLLASG